MPLVSNELLSQYWEPVATGPRAVADVSAMSVIAGLLATGAVPATGNWTSSAIPADGFVNVSIGLTSSQAGLIVFQRYLDQAGTIAQGAPITVALAAGVAAVLNATDQLIFRSFTLEVTNSGGSAATITNFAFLLMA